ncbi:MAG: helix-turn-helix domain-containing protein [Microthrixaceae bacterium]
MVTSGDRLDVLKALGDNTRYAIYLELARSPRPLSTSQIAESLGLHGNTVREHLERMRDVGLLDSCSQAAGTVGRPQKLYSIAEDAPSLGLEPSMFPMLSRMLVGIVADTGVDPDVILEAGRGEGRRHAQASDDSTVAGLAAMQEHLGFDPAVFQEKTGPDDDSIGVVHMAFSHCPVSEMAAENPGVICALHRGLVEGYIEANSALDIVQFNDVTHREPCRMSITTAADLWPRPDAE